MVKYVFEELKEEADFTTNSDAGILRGLQHHHSTYTSHRIHSTSYSTVTLVSFIATILCKYMAEIKLPVHEMTNNRVKVINRQCTAPPMQCLNSN